MDLAVAIHVAVSIRSTWTAAANLSCHALFVRRRQLHGYTYRCQTSCAVKPASLDAGNQVAAVHPPATKGTGLPRGESAVATFYAGKHVFITGGTGFLGKAIVEKLLRDTDVARITLLVQTSPGVLASDRLDQVLSSQVFGRVDNRATSKIDAVEGFVSRDGLGLSVTDAARLKETIDIIIHSAATTSFEERLDVALQTNSLGPRRLMRFARECCKLRAVVHISTAYVNGLRPGVLFEVPFVTGRSIATELRGASDDDEDDRWDTDHEVSVAAAGAEAAAAAAVASGLVGPAVELAVTRALVRLGLDRARRRGWIDAYVYTKALGEVAVAAEPRSNRVGLAIVRPSIIESAVSEPFPGWLEGMRMADPILIGYGKGKLNGFLSGADDILDIVPCDLVVNSVLLAAMAAAGRGADPPTIYQVATSVVNPLQTSVFASAMNAHFLASPLRDRRGRPIRVSPVVYYSSTAFFLAAAWLRFQLPSLLALILPEFLGLKRMGAVCGRTYAMLSNLVTTYSLYSRYAGRFDATNLLKLFAGQSDVDKARFGCDLASINWPAYLTDVHVPGLRKYVLKERAQRSGAD